MLPITCHLAKTLRTEQIKEADHSWEKRLKKYLAPTLLIIGDFGLSPLTPIQAEDLYEIVAERHLKSSIILTSNRPPQDWVPLFPDPVMANSALDRLVHRAHHLVIKGESFRKKLSPKPNSLSSSKVVK